MKNIFSASEETREVDRVFEQQARHQRGTLPTVPPCSQSIERSHRPLAAGFEELARRSAPGSAVSADLTYVWRR
jgi:hypothetical protein